MTEAFSAEEIEVMESNGITRGCALNRIKRLGWSREQAITKPPIIKTTGALRKLLIRSLT
ncbi:TPA: hypothetical protein RJQ32_002420 [Staphylococcus pseudintermedius]|nr:hypothetical protein [Staphylococcus pseudintermedius]EGQ2757772.1 hypothetical protein [Staphylococcus pseudintermedius]EJL1405653.1 hypothetical protein [Staphylococcus pseudintermedius]HCA7036219.1 hypothetical protein [Staphylococcus pseudintermedius]HDV6259823.1 hypothetical protein [Staphylococcus pseudintermedius]